MGFINSSFEYADGKWCPWAIKLKQPDGAGPSNYHSSGSKFTVFNGVFYGLANIVVANNSDLGATGSHWELCTPFKVLGDGSSYVIGTGIGHRMGAGARQPFRVELHSYYTYPEITAILPVLPYYNTATMDNPPDTNLLYEWWTNGTQAKVEATRTAWQAIATDFSRESQSELRMSMRIRYMVAN